MAGASLKARVRLTKGGKPEALLSQLHDRTQRLEHEIVRRAVKDLILPEIQNRIPNTTETDDYKQSLTFAEVRGAGQKGVYAVYVNPRARKVRRMAMSTTLLFVQSKAKGRRVRPDIQVLQANNPWTTDTIPYKPSNRDAILVSRRASRGMVTRVAEKKERTRSQWTKELRRAGARKFAPPKTIPRGLEAMPDYLLEAMRLEFRLGPGKSAPHWRPALLRIRRRLPLLLRRDRKLVYALTRPEFQLWKRWPLKTAAKVSMGEVRGFKAFQRRLGLRIK